MPRPESTWSREDHINPLLVKNLAALRSSSTQSSRWPQNKQNTSSANQSCLTPKDRSIHISQPSQQSSAPPWKPPPAHSTEKSRDTASLQSTTAPARASNLIKTIKATDDHLLDIMIHDLIHQPLQAADTSRLLGQLVSERRDRRLWRLEAANQHPSSTRKGTENKTPPVEVGREGSSPLFEVSMQPTKEEWGAQATNQGARNTKDYDPDKTLASPKAPMKNQPRNHQTTQSVTAADENAKEQCFLFPAPPLLRTALSQLPHHVDRPAPEPKARLGLKSEMEPAAAEEHKAKQNPRQEGLGMQWEESRKHGDGVDVEEVKRKVEKANLRVERWLESLRSEN